MLDVRPRLLESNFPSIKRKSIEVLQVNLGYLCNLSCTHCHVNAGPNRKELMNLSTINQVIDLIDQLEIQTLDLTGGAPELNPHFRYLVKEARKRGVHVMDRCNLTVLLEPEQEELAAFLAGYEVEVVASLPCYTQDNVDAQRGKGTFDASIKALSLLNSLGYGQGNPDLQLSLVYNPGGAFLPPAQSQLKADYKAHLRNHFAIEFDDLYTITNMPIARFGSVLLSKGTYDEYMNLLKSSYSVANLSNVMCMNTISIDWQGFVFDCDFNQMLDMPISHNPQSNPKAEIASAMIASDKQALHISQLSELKLDGHEIVVGEHCYGCTAGQGSSCGGALEA